MVIVEPNKIDYEHLVINKAMFEILQSLGVERGWFIGNKKHFENIGNKAGKVKHVFGLPSHKKLPFAIRFLVESLTIIFALIFALVKGERKVCFLSLTPLGHFTLSLMSVIFFFLNFYVIVHSEIAYIKSKSNPLFKLLMRLSIKFRISNVFHVFLSDHIRADRVLSSGNYIIINHPCSFDKKETKISFNGKDESRFVFSYVGMASYGKGLKYFEEVASCFREFRGYEFVIAGKVVEADFESDSISYFSRDFLPEREVGNILKESSFALFFYGKDYDWIASGAILDCVSFRIPVLALKSRIFLELEKSLGFVKCFDSVDDIIEFISDREELIRFGKECEFEAAEHYFSIDASLSRLRYCLY